MRNKKDSVCPIADIIDRVLIFADEKPFAKAKGFKKL